MQETSYRTRPGGRGYHVTLWHAADWGKEGVDRDGRVWRPPAELLAAIGQGCCVEVCYDGMNRAMSDTRDANLQPCITQSTEFRLMITEL